MKGFIEVHILFDSKCVGLIPISKISTIVPNDSNDGSVIEMNNCDRFAVEETYAEVKRLIEKAQEDRKTGRWFGTVCSACGESTSDYFDCAFCPHCGAEMEGEI